MERGLKCVNVIKKRYSSSPSLNSDEDSDTDLVSYIYWLSRININCISNKFIETET